MIQTRLRPFVRRRNHHMLTGKGAILEVRQDALALDRMVRAGYIRIAG